MRRLIWIALWASTCVPAAPYDQPVVKGDSPTKARAPANSEAVARILLSSLRAKVDRVESIDLYALIENAGPRAFRLFESRLQLRPGREPIDMTCNEISPTYVPLQPGESRLYKCGVSGNSYGLEGYFRDFAKANPRGTELPIRATRIEFVDPPVTVTTRGVSWHDRGLVGAVIAFTARRRGRAAAIASALGLAASVATGAIGGAALGGSMGILILGFLALVGLGAYLLALWIAVAVFGSFRRSPV